MRNRVDDLIVMDEVLVMGGSDMWKFGSDMWKLGRDLRFEGGWKKRKIIYKNGV